MSKGKDPKLRAEAGPPTGVPPSQRDVLACLWQKGRATARELREALRSYRPMTHGAMVTLLKRLEEKGLVSRSKAGVGKAFAYRPTRRPKRVFRSILLDLYERVFGQSGVVMFTSLFEARPPSPEELDELQRMLDDFKARARKEKKEE